MSDRPEEHGLPHEHAKANENRIVLSRDFPIKANAAVPPGTMFMVSERADSSNGIERILDAVKVTGVGSPA